MNEGALIGIWYADFRYGPGSMTDETLVLLADHRGFWRLSNAGSSYVEAFRWAMSGDGTLRITGTTGYDVDHMPEGYRVAEEPGRLHFEGLRFRIEWEDTPIWQRVEVLTLDEGQDRWQRALAETCGSLSSKFRRRQQLAGYRPPGF